MKMPYIQADFAAMYDSTGVCDSKKTLGVDIDALVGVELFAQAATKGHEASPFWKQDLYSHEWPLFSKCLAFGPKNAKSGEVAHPNPPAKKTKKPKSKKPKATKKPKKAKAKATKKPEISKKPKTKKPEPTKKAPKKTPKPTVEPTKASKKDAKTTKHTTKTTTFESTFATSKTTHLEESSESKSKNPSSKTTMDISATLSHSSVASTITTLSISSVSFSTVTGYTNSSRVRTHSNIGPDNTSKLPIATEDGDRRSSRSIIPTPSQSTGGDEILPEPSGGNTDGTPQSSGSADSQPSESTFGDRRTLLAASESKTSSAEAGTTKGPSTLLTATATFTTSSSSSTSSSNPDTCPVYGCKACKDSLDMDASTLEYFAIEADAPSSNEEHRKRFATREYTYVCKSITKIVTMARYPQFSDRIAAPHVTVSEFFQAVDATNCLDHAVTTTGNPPNPSNIGTPFFAMEHIYEGNWILNFLRYLHESENISCDDMASIFFAPASTNNAGDTWIQAIMESLGSTVNQDLLVFLRQNINGAKHRIFEDGNNIIEEAKFRNAKPTEKLARIATVGRALDYLAQPAVGSKLKKTAEKVEETLNALVAAIAASQDAGKLGDLASGDKLAKKHRKWLHSFMSSRNGVATRSVKRWASEASEELDKTTPGQPRATKVGRHTEPTLSFLQALQTQPPSGFNARRFAPLI
ncbi:hypothetical protein K505DRAFT_375265 [Melanomma pulvis-pyrius CBS 109.77]|uniref:DUF7223 domain-containing protein n=1 Tax=Melanomma pulvis-pyrius CBS 109.77 TaxID=1314802 RepID=A0A6A6XC99_9PLEO|nr:hypothetical protein K505DRAFT_375265 [Melanomma pulvis-pyrius CBS 109.77]